MNLSLGDRRNQKTYFNKTNNKRRNLKEVRERDQKM